MRLKCILTKHAIIATVLGGFISLFTGCSKDAKIQPPPPYYPSLAVERSDSLEIYQLYTSQFSHLDLSRKMLIYHLYRACIMGQYLGFDQDNEEFYISDSQYESSQGLVNILRGMITELELAIEFSEGETKKAIWEFIRFLQSSEKNQLTEYYEQLTHTFEEEVIFCLGFSDTINIPFSFSHIPNSKTTSDLRGAFGGAILIVDKDAEAKKKVIHDLCRKLSTDGGEQFEIITREKNLNPYELICAIGLYGPEIYPRYSHRFFTFNFTASNAIDIIITNLSAINLNEVAFQLSTDSNLLEKTYSSYKRVYVLTQLMSIGGSVEYYYQAQIIVQELLALWCMALSDPLDPTLMLSESDMTAVYTVFLGVLMSELLKRRDPELIDLRAASFKQIGVFLINERCMKIEKSDSGYYFALIDSEKMTATINTLMRRSIGVLRDHIKFAPAKTLGRQPEWLKELYYQAGELYKDVFIETPYTGRYWLNKLRYEIILPEPKLIRNKMGGITDVEMIHTLDYEGQMRRFSSLAVNSP